MSKYAFTQGLRELRIHLSQEGAGSNGARTFIRSSYAVMKKHNPQIPIMIREAAGVRARVYARYERGREEERSLEGLDESQVAHEIGGLASGKGGDIAL